MAERLTDALRRYIANHLFDFRGYAESAGIRSARSRNRQRVNAGRAIVKYAARNGDRDFDAFDSVAVLYEKALARKR